MMIKSIYFFIIYSADVKNIITILYYLSITCTKYFETFTFFF